MPGASRLVLCLLAAMFDGVAGSDIDLRHFVAGGLSAAISHGYTTPIDVVKTRMQTNPELYGGSVTTAARRIVKEDGFPFLLQGLAPTCFGYGLEGALKFGCYEVLKPVFAKLSGNKVLNMLAASVVAGAIASVVLCPAEDVRIRLVADPGYATGSVDALLKLSSEKGPLASFEGFPAMCAKQVPYTMGKQVSFDVACECVRSVFRMASGGEVPPALDQLVPCVAALPAAVLACLLSHPGDMILTEYYKGGGGSVIATLRKLVQEGGLAALFLGLRARLLHVISIIWVQLIIYDNTKQLLGLPASGH